MRHPSPALLLLVAAPLLAACGGGGKSDEDEIAEAIDGAAIVAAPGDCTTYSTKRFLEQTQSQRGQAAVRRAIGTRATALMTRTPSMSPA